MTRSGHDGAPPPGHDFGEFVRHALHAAADQVEPRPDGLERIRERVRSGPAYASKRSGVTSAAAPGGFLAHVVQRWNARRGGSPAHGSSAQGPRSAPVRRQPRDWRDGLLRSALAAACAVFAVGVALSVPPLRQAFVQLGSAVGIASHSSTGTPSVTGPGHPLSSSAGGSVRAASPAARPARRRSRARRVLRPPPRIRRARRRTRAWPPRPRRPARPSARASVRPAAARVPATAPPRPAPRPAP